MIYRLPAITYLTMMMFLAFTLFMLISFGQALYEDEAGKLDFLLATAGHGPVSYVSVEGTAVVTSDSVPQPWVSREDDSGVTSCYVASRNVADGKLNWRRNVCSSDWRPNQRHVVTSSSGRIFTLDDSGALRAWTVASGSLIWDATSQPTVKPLLWTFTKNAEEYVAAGTSKSLTVFDAATGVSVENPTAQDAQTAKPNSADDSLEAKCHKSELEIAVDPTSTSLLASHHDRSISSDLDLSGKDELTSLTLLACDENSASVLIASRRGVTKQFEFAKDADSIKWVSKWTAEEGLAHVSSALLLDSSHFVGELESDPDRLLQLNARLESQWKSVSALFSRNIVSDTRNHIFGFVKTAVLVSQSSHRLYGMDTVGNSRGEIRYFLDLPEDAEWHRMVHGAPNSVKASHGINGGTHGRELLVLSLTGTDKIAWTCLDGASGSVHARGSVPIHSPLAQIIPMTGGSLCKQVAFLMLRDGSLLSIPQDKETVKAVKDHILSAENGFYTHSIDKEKAMFESYAISDWFASGIRSRLVGSTSFPGEQIIGVAYPTRDEVVQSPCTVLGDYSLLLKYLDPHEVVILTMRTETVDDKRISAALQTDKKGPQKRKPAGASGASPVESSPASNEEPNFFVNVLDSASGRLLYRVSHANMLPDPAPSVVLSENWVFYTFMNEKTRRAELGVLSLYEGMIDSKGLTAFTSPEQSNTFSSLDGRESKPVVLAKTYSLATPPTALGVTSTRAGISGRRLIIAGTDGSIQQVDTKVVSPRRPLGQVKDSEKKEGLVQYSEVVPKVSYLSLCYNQTVESVKEIISSQTDLESQTLILAFGGPDIFFARTSPSRGFDLLPDSFNRVLLSVVVAGLLAFLLFVRRTVSKKMKKEGWI